MKSSIPCSPTFQSTPLMRGETAYGIFSSCFIVDFNPLPSCEGRRLFENLVIKLVKISIHSPHARGDRSHPCGVRPRAISIHSPHARGDGAYDKRGERETHISIHSPHARGDGLTRLCIPLWLISIHSPHARGDAAGRYDQRAGKISIHSPHARGDAILAAINDKTVDISIHSPHARGDSLSS